VTHRTRCYCTSPANLCHPVFYHFPSFLLDYYDCDFRCMRIIPAVTFDFRCTLVFYGIFCISL
jgi:hypothetical protein